jgi:hypothetical protein
MGIVERGFFTLESGFCGGELKLGGGDGVFGAVDALLEGAGC